MAAPQLDFSFPPPRHDKVDVLIIAGEHSGDEHAAKMVSGLLAAHPDLEVAAIGGRHLQEAGAQLLFDLTQFSVVGFFEVVKHLRSAFRLLDEILRWIDENKPRAVCFVDYPGLNLKIASKLHERGLASKAGGPIRLLYYISPQVWAWKGKRRFAMAKLLDSLAVIFPFEIETFDDTELDVQFVGHPFLASGYDLPVQYDPDGPVLLLAGSRTSALSRISPVLLDAFRLCLDRKKKLQAVSVYASDELKAILEAEIAKRPPLPQHVKLVPNSETVRVSAALTSSGTMSLKCALASVPGAILYRTHFLTYWMGRMLVKLPHIGIANLLLQEEMYPEYLQGAAKPKALAREVVACLESADRIKRTRALSAKLRELLDEPARGGADQWLAEQLQR